MEDFGELESSDQVTALHSLLQPYLLRRMKDNVEKSLPAREETLIEVELTVAQKRLYKAVFERNVAYLTQMNGTSRKNVPSLMNVAMQLRKCCNHPYLLKGVEETNVTPNMTQEEVMDGLVSASGKFVLLDKLIPKLISGGHKLLIFSQMVRVLDILGTSLSLVVCVYVCLFVVILCVSFLHIFSSSLYSGLLTCSLFAAPCFSLPPCLLPFPISTLPMSNTHHLSF